MKTISKQLIRKALTQPIITLLCYVGDTFTENLFTYFRTIKSFGSSDQQRSLGLIHKTDRAD